MISITPRCRFPTLSTAPTSRCASRTYNLYTPLLAAKIGQGLAKDPDVTALALEMLNPSLPGALVRQWWFEDPDLKSGRDEASPYELVEDPEDPFGDARDF